jgi:azurin
MKTSDRIITPIALASLALVLAACGSKDDPAPKAADSMEQAAGAVAEDAEAAMDAAGDSMSDAMDAMDDAASDAKEAAGEAMDEASAAMNEMGAAAEAAADDVKDAAASMAAGAAAVPADDGNPCTLAIQAGDAIAYSAKSLSVPSSCSEVTLTLTHTGSLPAQAMGHNWVLLPEDAVSQVATAGMSAGLEANYVPAGDDRVVAATKIVGGGESDTITFSLDALDAGTKYVYVCTFPGHWSVMKGDFTIS